MTRNRKVRARRSAASERGSLQNSARRRTHSFGTSLYARPLRCEQLEDRRLLAVVTVTTIDDTVDLSDGTTSLREAVFAANTVPGADEIRFDPALYAGGTRTILLTGGELAVTDSLTITGPGVSLLTINAQQQSRILNIGAGAGNFTATGLTLTGGSTTGDNAPTATGFESTYNGGAIRSVTAGVLTLERVAITGSSATGAHAIGGGVFATGPVSITSMRISGNTATSGGGLASRGSATLTASTVSSNVASDSALATGGGVDATGTLTLVNCTISGNRATVTGDEGSAYGGGIHATGAVSIAHSTIIANSASSIRLGPLGYAGGVAAADVAGSSFALSNSIVAGNLTTDLAAEMTLGAGAVTVRYSLIGDNDGTSLEEAPIGLPDPNGNLIGGILFGYIDPLLGGLADNGGPTRTHALLNGSPAISAADPGLTPGLGGTPQFDQRGTPYVRQQGTRIDMGAVENNLTPWIVDSLGDESDGNFGPGQLTLREAIERANSSDAADRIEFAPSLYAAGPAKIILTHGQLTTIGELDTRGPGASLITVDAAGNDPTPAMKRGDGSRVFDVTGPNSSIRPVAISGLTITGGDASLDGGGIRSTQELTLTNVAVVGNATRGNGGGVAATTILIRGSTIYGNTTVLSFGSSGGGVYTTKSLTIENSTISGNSSFSGSAVRVASASSTTVNVSILRSTFEGNVSPGSGAISVRPSFGDSLWLADSLVRGNQARGVEVLTSGSTFDSWVGFEILNCAIVDNTSTAVGAGVAANMRGVVENSTISGNLSTVSGGGISSSAALTVRHSTITNNVADSDGNSSGAGGGIFATRLTLDHTIVAGNRVGISGTRSDLGATPVAVGFSLIGDKAGTTLIEAPFELPDNQGNLIGGTLHGAIDPMLAPLADNGGPTPTQMLRAGSPAIDAGNTSLDPGEGDTPAFDQRWAPFSRVVGARIDIGALEAIGMPVVVDTLVDESDGDYRRGNLSLREAIELTNAQPGGDVIVFDAELIADGAATILLTQGELAITDSLTITGPGADLLTIDASGNDPTPDQNNGDGSRVLNIDAGVAVHNQSVLLRGVTLTGGDTATGGGAILSLEELTLEQVDIDGNAARSGGGVESRNRAFVIRDSVIGRNVANIGGALNLVGGLLERTIIEHNLATGSSRYSAGGVNEYGFWPFIVRYCVVRSNTSQAGGGGIQIHDGTAIIEGSLIIDNRGGNGGGIGVSGFGSLALSNSTIAANTALSQGGGLWFAGLSQLGLSVTHATISGNIGGGLIMEFGNGSIEYSTVVGNSASSVGGIVSTPFSFRVSHCIVAENSGMASSLGDLYLSVHGSITFSLIGNGRLSGFAEAPVGSPDANGNLIGGPIHGSIDPLLGPLADNGGPTLPGGAKLLTHALLPGSPAIGAGDPAVLPGQGGVPEFDQRGAPFTRLAGARIDIGAFEVQAAGGTLGADFDFNGQTDGADFLTWQRNLGKTSGATARQGDATADGDVDANDLAVWRARYGSGASAQLIAEELNHDGTTDTTGEGALAWLAQGTIAPARPAYRPGQRRPTEGFAVSGFTAMLRSAVGQSPLVVNDERASRRPAARDAAFADADLSRGVSGDREAISGGEIGVGDASHMGPPHANDVSA